MEGEDAPVAPRVSHASPAIKRDLRQSATSLALDTHSQPITAAYSTLKFFLARHELGQGKKDR